MSKKDILTTTLPTTNVVFNQDLKTGHCNLTELVEQSNEILGTNKRLDNILNLQSTKELIEYRKQLKMSNFCNSEDAENQALTKKEMKQIENEVYQQSFDMYGGANNYFKEVLGLNIIQVDDDDDEEIEEGGEENER